MLQRLRRKRVEEVEGRVLMKRLEMCKGDLCAQDLTRGSAKRARMVERPLTQAKRRPNGAPMSR
jgi:hypothetical protein